MSGSPSRSQRVLHERSDSQSNANNTNTIANTSTSTDTDTDTKAPRAVAAIRLVPKTPPRLLGQKDSTDDIYYYSRTPLPTHPSHILGPGRRAARAQSRTVSDDHDHDHGHHHLEFRGTTETSRGLTSTGSSVATTHSTPQPPPASPIESAATASPPSKPKVPAKKRLHIHKDNKTFSLLHDDASSSRAYLAQPQASSDSLCSVASNPRPSCASAPRERESAGSSTLVDTSFIPPNTPPLEKKRHSIVADPIANSPWNYELVGGLRKVPKTPDLKGKAVATADSPLPPRPETRSDGPPARPHHLSLKASFTSTQTGTSSSENTNYQVYRSLSASTSDAVLVPPPSSGTDSNYRLIGEPSPEPSLSSVIYRPYSDPASSVHDTADENYELHGDPSPAASSVALPHPQQKYSHESLVVPPLKPRARRSNESLGYYKQRSRESLRGEATQAPRRDSLRRDSLRSGSLTSISTVLSQQEAFHGIIGRSSLISIPILRPKTRGKSSWAEPAITPPRSHMNEHPHQWSSQLSTVLSESEAGTDRNSRSWSDGTGRRSSGFISSSNRHSRHVLSISSSVAYEAERLSSPGSASIEPPAPAFARNGRHHSSSSIRMVEDVDEYGDGITDMQDLRARPSRTRLSGFFSLTPSERTNTMRSSNSSRANSLVSNSLPTWAKLYYGSGERRYLGAPGSSTEGTDSRSNSFARSGSPNTDHFPLSIYSPRRRPRELNARGPGQSNRGSLEITPAPQLGSDGRLIQDPSARRFRTWSMSSVWSPHLRLDRRAAHRSLWEPPSVDWSTEGGMFGRRNVQVVMFIAGFLFPFAWMIAAILPLPPCPNMDMRERDTSTENLDSTNITRSDYARQFGPVDEVRYESARWWRKLNRWMSIVGLLIVITVVILVVVGLEQGW